MPLQPGRATCRGAAVHLHANLLPIAAAAPAAAWGAGEAYNDKATSCGRQWGKSNSAYDWYYLCCCCCNSCRQLELALLQKLYRVDFFMDFNSIVVAVGVLQEGGVAVNLLRQAFQTARITVNCSWNLGQTICCTFSTRDKSFSIVAFPVHGHSADQQLERGRGGGSAWKATFTCCSHFFSLQRNVLLPFFFWTLSVVFHVFH